MSKDKCCSGDHDHSEPQEECGGSEESCSCDCGCCDDDTGFPRRYQTKAEMIAELEAYLEDLKTETQAVEEHLQDLRK